MRNTLIVDTGFLVALANKNDKYHQKCVEVSKALEGDLITTWPVITETSYFMMKQANAQAHLSLLDRIHKTHIMLWQIPVDAVNRIKILMKQYNDLPMDLADASLVVLAEQLGHGDILSTDRRDFNTYRWKNHQPFKNLLFPND